ncbi:MAG: glycosyltransferase family 1 protein, partial [Alphaproteobacteria bacterium]
APGGRRIRTRRGLGRALGAIRPRAYLNLGHANWRGEVAQAARAAGARVLVLVHDTIPLDHPDLCRPGTAARFGPGLARILALADVVAVVSGAARDALARHHPEAAARAVVAPIGVERPPPEAIRGAAEPPLFVTLGTIEPRKNLALLLDVWEALLAERGPDPVPRLVVAGPRGWERPEVLARLDRLAASGAVVPVGAVGERARLGLLGAARALLFPSLAEGFGLPPLEAAALGVPVLASPVGILPEIPGDWALYLNPHDRYAWKKTIIERAGDRHENAAVRQERAGRVRLPDWEAHFDRIFTLL